MLNLNSLFDKDVISVNNASILGEIFDVEIDENSGKINSLIIRGKLRFFGLFGRKENTVIPWHCVSVIGEETILVNIESNNSKYLLE